MFCFALCLYLLAGCASWKPDPWTPMDTAGEAVFLTLLAADYGQTQWISETPGHREMNKLLGPHPSEQKVRWYFGACAVGHAGIAWILPDPLVIGDMKIYLRKIWQYVWIGMQV